jgi:hypothetical protein
MAQAANKLYSRGEIRCVLRDLANDWARMIVTHRDAFRHDKAHDETTCKTCLNWKGHVEGIEWAIQHFGGRYRG